MQAMNPALLSALQGALGTRLVGCTKVQGGDINRAYRVQCSDGRRLFVKTHDHPPAGAFGCEAAGLGWLGAAGALATPAVVAVRDETPAFLVLEWVEPGRPDRRSEEALGRGLAALHGFGAPGFGLDHDNFIAVLPQANGPCADWAEFYGERRLAPLLERALTRGLCAAATARRFERLFAALPALCGPAEPAARLHGDLWSGNVLYDARGQPVLIDPAVYGGHREVDLAMMRLFGGFGPRVFDAYREYFPLSDGHEQRVALYQLYPLLLHVNLFGGGYLGQLEGALERALSATR